MLLAPLESMLNRNIAASSAARAACARLDGKTLAVHVTAGSATPRLSLYFSCKDAQLTVASSSDAVATATLSGSPLAYLGMLGAPPESALRSGSVRIEGDAEAAQAFRELLRAAQPDVEEEFARVIGDVPAHQLGKLARGAAAFGKRVTDTFAQNVTEYLQEESRDLVTRIEVDEFCEAVDRLRDDVDRAAARLELLRKAVEQR